MERKSNAQPKLNIRKGDTVKVIAGENKGQQGKVLEVMLSTRKVLVERVNLVSKHTKPNAKNTQGGIVKQEAPIHISNVMLVDPSSGKATRVGRKSVDGKLVRYAKKSGEVIK
jgi:large subunit ribosomal protein L24